MGMVRYPWLFAVAARLGAIERRVRECWNRWRAKYRCPCGYCGGEKDFNFENPGDGREIVICPECGHGWRN